MSVLIKLKDPHTFKKGQRSAGCCQSFISLMGSNRKLFSGVNTVDLLEQKLKASCLYKQFCLINVSFIFINVMIEVSDCTQRVLNTVQLPCSKLHLSLNSSLAIWIARGIFH